MYLEYCSIKDPDYELVNYFLASKNALSLYFDGYLGYIKYSKDNSFESFCIYDNFNTSSIFHKKNNFVINLEEHTGIYYWNFKYKIYIRTDNK